MSTKGWFWFRVSIYVILGLFVGLRAEAQTLTPEADAYIRNGSYASSNFGTASSLVVKTSSVSGNTRYTLLRFNLTGVDVSNATAINLRLYVTTASSITIGAYRSLSNWVETSATWNNAPAVGALLASTPISVKNKYYNWDVTTYIKDSVAKGGTLFSFLLKDVASGGYDVIFSSRESSSNKPQLAITTPSAPAAPTVLSATVSSSTQINLSWNDNASNETGYKIESKTGSGAYTLLATVGANVKTYSHTGLTSLTTYNYRVYAYNNIGNSSFSNETSSITSSVFSGTAYYIDSVNGNDANTGTSPAAAWKNLSKLHTLNVSAGSRIWLRAGSVWTGQQLKFNGSGTSGSPIMIDKYDVGAKPVLHGNGLVGQGVIYLYNQKFIEIANLEITNDPKGPFDGNYFLSTNPNGGDRRGVMVAIDNYGTAEHIYFRKLDIHHVKGQLGSGETAVNGAIPKRTGGIFFTVLGLTETSAANSRFHDILVDSCTVAYCENIGLAIDNEWNVYYPGGQFSSLSADVTEYNNWYNRRNSNLRISNSTFHHIGKNALIIRMADSTGRIEYNTCYETALGTTGNTMFTARCKGTVFQYNEGFTNRATTQTVNPGSIDGSLYDADYGSVGVIFQYSYSHDNSEGLWWGCNTRGSANNTSGVPDPGDVGVTVRYNISQNDKGDLIFFNYPSAGNEIYNNVFYIGSGLSPNIIHESSKQHTYHFYNNIIYNQSATADYSFKDVDQNRVISSNIFYGNHPTGTLTGEPADANKLTSDPRFAAVGTGGLGLASLAGYKLLSNSPALNSGQVINNNGGKDFWGNLLYSGNPDRGAHEYTTALLSSSPLGPLTEKGSVGLRVYPNPNNGYFNLSLYDVEAGSALVKIVDVNGSVLYRREHFLVAGLNILPLALQKATPGVYLVQVMQKGKVQAIRLVKE